MTGNDEPAQSLSARTISGLGWSYLGTFIKAFMTLLVLVVLARLLAPLDFGLFGIAWIFTTMGGQVRSVICRTCGYPAAGIDRASYSSRFYPVITHRRRGNGSVLAACAGYR